MITSEELQKSFHYLYPKELPELKRIASLLPESPKIVNIGAGAGTSGLAFMEARPDATLWTIDVQDEDSPLGSLYAEREVFRRAGLTHLSGVRWFQIQGDSKEVSITFERKSVDLVFIDGDHSYLGCLGDIVNWIPKVKPHGYLLIHDYNKQLLELNEDGPHPREWPGVNRSVDNLIQDGFQIFSLVESLVSFQLLPGNPVDLIKEFGNYGVENINWIETLGGND